MESRGLAQLSYALRGVLADRSGNEDDPYARVLLRWSPRPPAGRPLNNGNQPPLELEAPGETVNPDQMRVSVEAAVSRYCGQYGVKPASIKVAGQPTGWVWREPPVDGRPLHNKVALVTGAGGAIGGGICRELLAKGCCVVATDVSTAALDNLAEQMGAAGAERLVTVRMDVTDAKEVALGFDRAALAFGGVDIVVANAGVAATAALMDMELETFRRVARINLEGTLITLAETGRRLQLQRTGGDIVFISTKNVFAPGAEFGAYSATKAAAHQLARIASLEFASIGVRVNMVAPDAVFADGMRRSGLWAEVGPARMRARGLDEKGLEEYYRNRNLLKARVTAQHVANAVLFLVTRQTPTTGATIPVDGGLPDATPR